MICAVNIQHLVFNVTTYCIIWQFNRKWIQAEYAYMLIFNVMLDQNIYQSCHWVVKTEYKYGNLDKKKITSSMQRLNNAHKQTLRQ